MIAVAVIGMLAITTQAFSQGYCTWDNWEMGAGQGWWNYNVPVQNSLSADQITRMNEIRSQNQQQILPLQNKLNLLRIEMNSYVSGDEADVNEIKKYRNQIRDLEDQIADLRLDARNEINKLLTKEQRGYFNRGRYGWWDTDNDWWHMGCGMMYDYGMSRRGTMDGWRGRCCW